MKEETNMKVYKEVYGSSDFDFWGGAVDTYNDIIDAGKENEFWDLLEEIFSGRECVPETELNDFVWFERDYIYNLLGLDENSELIDNNDNNDDDNDDDDGLWGDDE